MTKFTSYYRPASSGEGTTIGWGRLDGDTIYDATSVAPSLAAAIADGALEKLAGHSGDPVALADVQLAPVIPSPGKIICIGVNYRSHQDEIGKAAPAAPVIFARYADSQMGHDEDALKPRISNEYDYEGEVALVISKPAFKVKKADAYDHIAGYAAYNDFSVRDWQRRGQPVAAGQDVAGHRRLRPVSRDDRRGR